ARDAGGARDGAPAGSAARVQRARGAGRARGPDRPGRGGRAARGDPPGPRGAVPDQRRGQPAGAADVGRPVAGPAPPPAPRHHGSGVTSMWPDNGVRAHHRFMDQRKNEATITITLAGGPIQETAADRGLTEAALRAWDRPATGTLSSTEIRDLMTGAKARVRSAMSGDTATLTVSGEPAELERGLQLAYLLLTDPVIEPAALAQWKDAETQRIAARKNEPMQALATTSARAI